MTTTESIQLITAIGLGGFISTLVNLYFNTSNARKDREFDEKKAAYSAFLDAYQAIEYKGFTEVKEPSMRFRALLNATDRIVLVSSPQIVKDAVAVVKLVHSAFDPDLDDAARDELDGNLGAAYNTLRNAMRQDLNINTEPLELKAR
jgi:hypothetical protein